MKQLTRVWVLSLVALLTYVTVHGRGDFTIPNNDVAFNVNQSIWMSTDIAALVQGIKGEGVLAGCAVTAQAAPALSVAVASGTVQLASTTVTVTGGNLTVPAGGTQPRFDIITVNASGTKTLTSGTPAASPAAPSIPASSVLLATIYVPILDSTIESNQIVDKRVIVPAAIPATPTVQLSGYAGGRLTTETGVPVSTSDRTAQSILYYTPFTTGTGPANQLGYYNTSTLVWHACTFTEFSLTLSGLTSGKAYDVFAVDAGSCANTLELSTAWASASSRTDAITQQDGVDVKSSDKSRRLVGTIYTTGTTTTADSQAQRLVWSRYNQVRRTMRAVDTTDSWTYTVATWRQARATATNQLEYVVGNTNAAVDAVLVVMSSNTSAASRGTCIGVDSTTVPSGQCGYGSLGSGLNQMGTAVYHGVPGLGRHTLVWLEFASATGTATWFGDAGDVVQSGISGSVIN